MQAIFVDVYTDSWVIYVESFQYFDTNEQLEQHIGSKSNVTLHRSAYEIVGTQGGNPEKLVFLAYPIVDTSLRLNKQLPALGQCLPVNTPSMILFTKLNNAYGLKLGVNWEVMDNHIRPIFPSEENRSEWPLLSTQEVLRYFGELTLTNTWR